MTDKQPPADQPAVSFADPQDRTITTPVPPRPPVPPKPAIATEQDTDTEQDTNLRRTVVATGDSVQEIFERTPHWFTRWGSALVLVILGVVISLMASVLVPYPTTLNADTTLGKDKGGQVLAELSLPVAATTDLALRQPVTLELNKYPAGCFGYLTGEVNRIQPPASDEGSYLITVSLPHGLITTENFHVPFEHGLNGKAKITISEQSLVYKVLR